MANSHTNDKLIYQFGNAQEPNYVFFKGNFTKETKTGSKTVYNTSSYIEGDVDMLQTSNSAQADYELECNFSNPLISPYELNFINRAFIGRKKITFFYDYEYNKNLNVLAQRNFGKVYYSYARVIDPPDQNETQRENMDKVDLENTITLKQKPFFYDCTDSVEYIDYATYISSLPYWGGTTWGGSFWGYPPSSFGTIASLSNANKLLYFTDLKADQTNYFMQLRDRFFARDTSQTARNYIVNTSIGSGVTTDLFTADVLGGCSAKCYIFRVELSQMSANQEIQIINTNNGSATSIKWLDSVSSNAVLVYNSYTRKLYETTNETAIDENKYLIDIPTGYFDDLYFSSILNPFAIATPPTEIVRLINSTGTILDVKIDVLPTYY